MANRKLTPEERFWSKVDKSGDCWLWTAALKPDGYGYFYPSHSEKRLLAHRASWVLHFGEIPSDLLVCHHCDVRSCVRPDHLFLGTTLANARDRERKGRGVLVKGVTDGERNLNAKLTAADVLRLRAEHEAWHGSKRRLHLARAAEFGVSETCIREAIKGKTKWINLK